MISWKYSFEEISKDLELAKKKKQALEDLFSAGKISESTYESLDKGISSTISEIEKRQKDLAEKMTSKLTELGQQINTLEIFLANSEIQHVAGEIDDELHERESNAFSLGLDALRQQLDSIKGIVGDIMPEVLAPTPPSEPEVTEPEEAAEAEAPTTEEVTEEMAEIPVETPVEEAPVEEAPVEEAPVEVPEEAEAISEETPVEEAPVQEGVETPTEMPTEEAEEVTEIVVEVSKELAKPVESEFREFRKSKRREKTVDVIKEFLRTKLPDERKGEIDKIGWWKIEIGRIVAADMLRAPREIWDMLRKVRDDIEQRRGM